MDHVSEAAANVGDAMRTGASRLKDEAGRQGAAAVDALKDSAYNLGEQARDRVAGFAETQRDAISGHLDTFAEAIRKASDDLSQHDQTLASQVVRQAAGGLESMSRSIHGVTFGDLLDSVRSFGRRNPAAFIGGAVLAGFAIGRFARSSGRTDDDFEDGWQPRNAAGPGRDSTGRFVSRNSWGEERGGNEGISPSPYRGSPYRGSTGGASTGGASSGSRYGSGTAEDGE